MRNNRPAEENKDPMAGFEHPVAPGQGIPVGGAELVPAAGSPGGRHLFAGYAGRAGPGAGGAGPARGFPSDANFNGGSSPSPIPSWPPRSTSDRMRYCWRMISMLRVQGTASAIRCFLIIQHRVIRISKLNQQNGSLVMFFPVGMSQRQDDQRMPVDAGFEHTRCKGDPVFRIAGPHSGTHLFERHLSLFFDQ